MSKREDFEAALVDHLNTMMYWVVEKRGGVHKVLNDLFFAMDDPEYKARLINMILKKKRITDKELSSDRLEVATYKVTLTAEFKPEWTYWVRFDYDDELANAWNIDGMLITLAADKSYKVAMCKTGDADNEKLVEPTEDDPLWDYFRTLVNGETYLKTMEFSKQSQL